MNTDDPGAFKFSGFYKAEQKHENTLCLFNFNQVVLCVGRWDERGRRRREQSEKSGEAQQIGRATKCSASVWLCLTFYFCERRINWIHSGASAIQKRHAPFRSNNGKQTPIFYQYCADDKQIYNTIITRGDYPIHTLG